MPGLKLLVIPPTPWTKLPNVILDRHMPELRDTELRVLLVLLRQTTGRGRDGRTVSLSYRTLMRRTGRQSEAIAKALRSLRAKGLIHSARSPMESPARFPKEVTSGSEPHVKDKKIKEQRQSAAYPQVIANRRKDRAGGWEHT